MCFKISNKSTASTSFILITITVLVKLGHYHVVQLGVGCTMLASVLMEREIKTIVKTFRKDQYSLNNHLILVQTGRAM